jgi:hypothetical protein
MQNRAEAKGRQGQWYDEQDIIEAEKKAPPNPGTYVVEFNRPIGRTFLKGGSADNPVEGLTRAFVQRRPDGTINTSFPVEDSYQF